MGVCLLDDAGYSRRPLRGDGWDVSASDLRSPIGQQDELSSRGAFATIVGRGDRGFGWLDLEGEANINGAVGSFGRYADLKFAIV